MEYLEPLTLELIAVFGVIFLVAVYFFTVDFASKQDLHDLKTDLERIDREVSDLQSTLDRKNINSIKERKDLRLRVEALEEEIRKKANSGTQKKKKTTKKKKKTTRRK